MKQRKSSHENNLLIFKYNFTTTVYSVNKEKSNYNEFNYNQIYL